MQWFKVRIIDVTNEKVRFEIPIQCHIQASVEGKFRDFLDGHPEYKQLVDRIGEYRIQSEHMNVHTWPEVTNRIA